MHAGELGHRCLEGDIIIVETPSWKLLANTQAHQDQDLKSFLTIVHAAGLWCTAERAGSHKLITSPPLLTQ